jgi:hypothetical protein
MEKYFETISRVMFHVKHKTTAEQGRAVKLALAREHDAGPESAYLLREWRKHNG